MPQKWSGPDPRAGWKLTPTVMGKSMVSCFLTHKPGIHCRLHEGNETYESLGSISSEERLAGLARDGVEVESERLVAAHAAHLVLLVLTIAHGRRRRGGGPARLRRRRRRVHRRGAAVVMAAAGRTVAARGTAAALRGPGASARAAIHGRRRRRHRVGVQFDVHHVGSGPGRRTGRTAAARHDRLMSVVVVATGIAAQTYSYSYARTLCLKRALLNLLLIRRRSVVK